MIDIEAVLPSRREAAPGRNHGGGGEHDAYLPMGAPSCAR